MKKNVLFTTYAAAIAALYTVLTVWAGSLNLASGVIQVRFSEALTILAAFTPAAIPGLWLGCILSNILTGCMPLDVIFGSLATLIGAVGTFALTHKFSDGEFVYKPGKKSILSYVYQFEGSIPFFMLTVGAGEVISCYILGLALYNAIEARRAQIFKA